MTTARNYIVTITPKHKAYSGSWSSGQYTVEQFANDRAQAIKYAREEYNNQAIDAPATFTAKLAQ